MGTTSQKQGCNLEWFQRISTNFNEFQLISTASEAESSSWQRREEGQDSTSTMEWQKEAKSVASFTWNQSFVQIVGGELRGNSPNLTSELEEHNKKECLPEIMQVHERRNSKLTSSLKESVGFETTLLIFVLCEWLCCHWSSRRKPWCFCVFLWKNPEIVVTFQPCIPICSSAKSMQCHTQCMLLIHSLRKGVMFLFFWQICL